MNFLFVFLYVAVSFSTVYSAVAMQKAVKKPADMADQEGCYIVDLDRLLPYNEPYSPQDGKTCVQYNCLLDDTISMISCGVLAVSKDCVIVPGDKFLPYPDCCDQSICN